MAFLLFQNDKRLCAVNSAILHNNYKSYHSLKPHKLTLAVYLHSVAKLALSGNEIFATVLCVPMLLKWQGSRHPLSAILDHFFGFEATVILSPFDS